MIAFFRLIRGWNLLIIALTMTGVVYFLQREHEQSAVGLTDVLTLDFVLLLIASVLIAAAGNIINDYFDVKADRINRPDRLVVTKSIKRRSAILMHSLFNVAAVSIGLYLGWKYQTAWVPALIIGASTLLWWYSVQLKRKALVGNLLVSILTSVVFFQAWNFYFVSHSAHQAWTLPIDNTSVMGKFSVQNILWLFMLIALVQNLARELIKDSEDVKGDEAIHAKTLPMMIGIQKTNWIVALLLCILPILMLSFPPNGSIANFDWTLLAAMTCNLIAIPFSLGTTSLTIRIVKNLIKVSFVFGIIYFFD